MAARAWPEVQEGVRQADFSPDGSQLAIIREVAGKDRLEYPIGHVLRAVSGYMSDLRFSPHGDRIAYFEHPRKWDDRGAVSGYMSDLRFSPHGDRIAYFEH